MKKLWIILLIVLVGCSNVTVDPETPDVETPVTKKFDRSEVKPLSIDEAFHEPYLNFVKSSTQALLKEVTSDQNFIYSPMSFYLALAMLEPITFDESLKELYHVLGTESVTEMSQLFHRSLTFENDVGISKVANSLWFQEGLNFNQARLDTIKKEHLAQGFQVDFRDKTKTMETMSQWIDQQTNNFIKNIDLEIDPLTVLAVINTIYVKDAWLNPFEKAKTINDHFHISADKHVEVPFMTENSIDLKYFKNDQMTVVSKELANGGEVLFVLPEGNVDTLVDLEQIHLGPAKVNLKLPKFDVSSEFGLIEVAKALGLNHILDEFQATIRPFEDDAITVYISKIKQQARLNIDEIGLEAAAYTSIFMEFTSSPRLDEVEVSFDRPFQIILRDRSGLILFVGIVNNPGLE